MIAHSDTFREDVGKSKAYCSSQEPWTIEQSPRSESYTRNMRSGEIADGRLVPASFCPYRGQHAPSTCLARHRSQFKQYGIIRTTCFGGRLLQAALTESRHERNCCIWPMRLPCDCSKPTRTCILFEVHINPGSRQMQLLCFRSAEDSKDSGRFTLRPQLQP